MVKVKFYSLSTCIWCRKTRNHLDENHIQYEEVVVDQTAGEAREKLMKELEKYNPNRSFPTLVFPNNTVVVGFKPEEIRKALGEK